MAITVEGPISTVEGPGIFTSKEMVAEAAGGHDIRHPRTQATHDVGLLE